MNLNELISKGAFIESGVTSKAVTWTNDAGESVSFDIFVKKEMSAADYEFIYFGFGAEADEDAEKSIMARRVHRLVRIGDGKEVIAVEDARRMKYSLLMLICARINEVHDPKEAAAKK